MKILILSLILLPTIAFAECPKGYTLNTAYNKCETIPVCPTGFALHPETDICFRPFSGKCLKGSVRNEADNTCVTPTICPEGTLYNMEIGKCLTKEPAAMPKK